MATTTDVDASSGRLVRRKNVNPTKARASPIRTRDKVTKASCSRNIACAEPGTIAPVITYSYVTIETATIANPRSDRINQIS